MLAQLLLPAVHAAGYARRQGDPLAYAACGIGSPALLAQMRARLPVELVDRLERQHAAPESPDCTLCLTVHGLAAASATAASASWPASRPSEASETPRARGTAQPVLPPPARGPPTPV